MSRLPRPNGDFLDVVRIWQERGAAAQRGGNLREIAETIESCYRDLRSVYEGCAHDAVAWSAIDRSAALQIADRTVAIAATDLTFRKKDFRVPNALFGRSHRIAVAEWYAEQVTTRMESRPPRHVGDRASAARVILGAAFRAEVGADDISLAASAVLRLCPRGESHGEMRGPAWYRHFVQSAALAKRGRSASPTLIEDARRAAGHAMLHAAAQRATENGDHIQAELCWNKLYRSVKAGIRPAIDRILAEDVSAGRLPAYDVHIVDRAIDDAWMAFRRRYRSGRFSMLIAPRSNPFESFVAQAARRSYAAARRSSAVYINSAIDPVVVIDSRSSEYFDADRNAAEKLDWIRSQADTVDRVIRMFEGERKYNVRLDILKQIVIEGKSYKELCEAAASQEKPVTRAALRKRMHRASILVHEILVTRADFRDRAVSPYDGDMMSAALDAYISSLRGGARHNSRQRCLEFGRRAFKADHVRRADFERQSQILATGDELVRKLSSGETTLEQISDAVVRDYYGSLVRKKAGLRPLLATARRQKLKPAEVSEALIRFITDLATTEVERR